MSRVVDGGGWREKRGGDALTKSKCQAERSILVMQVSDPSLLLHTDTACAKTRTDTDAHNASANCRQNDEVKSKNPQSLPIIVSHSECVGLCVNVYECVSQSLIDTTQT